MKPVHYIVFFIITFLLLGSCKKGFEELNQNPNAITADVIDPELLFPKSVIKPFDSYNVGINTELWSLMTWTQMVASTNSVSITEEFQYGGSDVDAIWGVLYTEALSNVNEVITLTNNESRNVNKNAIARIWRVYLYHIITDLWGDVPYSDALGGNREIKNLYPKYDTQQSIYSDMLSELGDAVKQMDEAHELLSTDIIYGGDLKRWTKFANTLRLRLAIRIQDANPSLAQEIISKLIIEDNLISSEQEGAYFEYSYGDNVRSPIAEGYRQSQVSELPSQLFVNMLLNDNDPRLEYMVDSTQESKIIGIFGPYVGAKNFSAKKQEPFNLSEMNSRFTGGDNFETPEARPIITYEETCLLKAEAALKGFGGDVTTLVIEGVTAHMKYLDVPDTSIAKYTLQLSSNPITQEIISTEKWKMFFMRDGYEAYAEWRRTGFPKVLNENGGELNQTLVPTKLPYPNTEISRNENINSLNISPTDMFSKVWWDIN